MCDESGRIILPAGMRRRMTLRQAAALLEDYAAEPGRLLNIRWTKRGPLLRSTNVNRTLADHNLVFGALQRIFGTK
jgi:hypothetical protein